MGCESFDVVGFDLGPLLQGQMRIDRLKSGYYSLIIGPRGLRCETNLYEIMAWESSGVVGFDLGPLLQGQTRIGKLKVLTTCLLLKNAVYLRNYISWPFPVDTSCAYNSLIIGPRGLQCETNL